MAELSDQYEGQGGSYVLEPDGTRRLVFRTGVGDVTPPPKPKPAPKPERTTEDG